MKKNNNDIFNALFGMNQEKFEDTLSNYLRDAFSEEDANNEIREKRDKVMKYTDEDFADDDKLNEFLNETDAVLDEFENLSPLAKSMVNAVLGDEWYDKITNLQDEAISANVRAKRQKAIEKLNNKKEKCGKCESCTCNKTAKTTKTEELAAKYVQERIVPAFVSKGVEITLDECEDTKLVLTDFANWILEQ